MASGEEQSSATVISSFSAQTLLMPALQGNGQSFATTGDAARTVFHRQRKATQAAIPPAAIAAEAAIKLPNFASF
jgi:hypothetical protein